MGRLTPTQIEQNVAELANRPKYDENFLYELLAAYGRPKSSVTMLKSGALNKATAPNEILQKDVVYFKSFEKGTLLEEEVLRMNDLVERYKPRYIIATDFENIAARDLKKGTTLSIRLSDIDREWTFFYGWSGNEVLEESIESALDRRAADCMKDLYDAIEEDNKHKFTDASLNFRHDLNIFFSRLLFCFFAEDTGLFEKNLFSEAIKNYTDVDGDGSDVKPFLEEVFKALDTEDRSSLRKPFSDFPYVNGSIFNTYKNNIVVPDFGPESRWHLLRCSNYDWSSINPDIFGTIFQGIVDEDKRSQNGMDYTSVSNIEKVINPLFMDELEEEFEKDFETDNRVGDKAARRIRQLDELWDRISRIKIFDPACGSGNFLIIIYKRLRELELRILQEKVAIQGSASYARFTSRIKLENFYGIELEDFPRELAVLSMFIAEHQMNMAFNEEFGKKIDMLPITDMPNIVCGNAARLDWQEVCPNIRHQGSGARETQVSLLGDIIDGNEREYYYDEIYVIGNPPYKGSSLQDGNQKNDLKIIFEKSFDQYKNLDYISIWFKKGTDYIYGTKARMSFVSTNSICQGEQVGILWPYIIKKVEIGFVYTSFKWNNNAKNNAGVSVIVISLRNISNDNKYIYHTDSQYEEVVKNINPYLIDADNIIMHRLQSSISGFPELVRGSMPTDGGAFSLSADEKDELLSECPAAAKYIKKYTSGEEFLKGIRRWCLWIEDDDVCEASKIDFIKDRLDRVRDFRLKSKAPTTVEYAKYPNRFRQKAYKDTDSIVLPLTSSERRVYIPMDFRPSGTVATNSAGVIYDAELWLFSILQSRMHVAWIRTMCGYLGTSIRYSNTLGYNTFPCPPLTEAQKEKLSASAENILMMRENHSEMTLAQMYDPEKMPEDLRQAHEDNDVLVDKLYCNHAFGSDEERLAILLKIYEQMTKGE